VLLSTVLEKGGDGTLVAVGAGCLASYARRKTHASTSFPLGGFSPSAFPSRSFFPPPCSLSCPFSHFALDIAQEKIMRYKVRLLARSFACQWSPIHATLLLNEETGKRIAKRVAPALPPLESCPLHTRNVIDQADINVFESRSRGRTYYKFLADSPIFPFSILIQSR